MYASMASYVGKILHIRPSEILDEWTVPELIVTYGNYANEQARRNYEDWKSLEPRERVKHPHPPEYAVKFYGVI